MQAKPAEPSGPPERQSQTTTGAAVNQAKATNQLAATVADSTPAKPVVNVEMPHAAPPPVIVQATPTAPGIRPEPVRSAASPAPRAHWRWLKWLLPWEGGMANAKAIPINLSMAKAIFDWSLKLIPIFGFLAQFLFQFYMQQNRTVDRTTRDDSRIQKLETELNVLDRELVEQKIVSGTLAQKVEDQERYYLLTRPR